jgi:Ca2+-binding RTX toxin-like protein
MRRARRRARLLPVLPLITDFWTRLTHDKDVRLIATRWHQRHSAQKPAAPKARNSVAVLALVALLAGLVVAPASAQVTVTDNSVFSVAVAANESVSITCSGGKIQVSVDGAASPFTTDCADVTSLSVGATGDFDNDIDLSGVTAVLFPSLSIVSIDGGGGADNLTGSELDDNVRGGTGADTFKGLGGNDVFTWDPGDGSDVVIGGDGKDTLVFNGSDADEVFALNPDGTRFALLRDLGNIDMQVESTETLQLFGRGGDDSLTVGDLTGVADLTSVNISMGDGNDTVNASTQASTAIAMNIQGDAGDDTLIGSQNADIIDGGPGSDAAVGGKGSDTFFGQDGNDSFTWVPGDGSDLVVGGAGNDTFVFTGSDADEVFALNPNGTAFEMLRNLGNVDMQVESTETVLLFGLGGADSLTVGDLSGVADLSTVQVSMGDGDDTVDASAQASTAVELTIRGGAGDDTLTGSPNADLMDGGAGNDVAVGGKGADTFIGRDGNDTFTWNPGDGSDLVIGGDGDDTLVFNGSDADEDFTLNPDGTAFELLRNLGNIDMQVESTETLQLFGLGGADSLKIADLSGVADLTSVNISMGDGPDTVDATAQANAAIALTIHGDAGDDTLTGSPNPDLIDGEAGNDLAVGGKGADTFLGQDGNDTFTWNPGDGSDVIIGGDGKDTLVFNGSDADEVFTLNPDETAFELLRNLGNIDMKVQSTEALQLFGLGGADSLTVGDLSGVADLTSVNISMGDGADTVDASAQANTAIALTIHGDAGDDTLTGSPNADLIDGGADNDFAVGGKGADTFLGQDGNDTFTWNPGDGSDVIIGGDGSDRLVFNGSAADEVFTVSASATGFDLTRDVGKVVMNAASTELLVLSAFDGDDVVRTVGLPDTAQRFDGGGQVLRDELNIDARGARTTSTSDTIQIEGAQPINFVGFEALNVLNESQIVNVLPPRSCAFGLLVAGLLVAATFRLRRRRSS